MKKIISFVLSLILLSSVFMVPSVSAAVESNEYFDDGSFISVGYGSPEHWESTDGEEEADSHDIVSLIKRIIEFIKTFFKRFFGNDENKVQTVTRTKYAAYYDSKGNLLWTVYLTADFTFDGKKAECTDVRTSYNIKDGDWKLLSADCERAGNTASGTFAIKQYKLGVPLKEIEKTLTLTCDEKGNIK